MIDRFGGSVFKQMILFGAACVEEEKQHINDLNVFPVPDGDTGTNMSLTMAAAVCELKKCDPQTVDEAAKITASGLLRGARGNSGVILSLLFRGMSKAFRGAREVDGIRLAIGLTEGVTTAYNAVMKPAEGTVLTVSRLAAQRAVEAAKEKNSAEYVLEEALKAGEETLAATIETNPVLKKAGVVDAGGKGYMVILSGMLRALRGEEIPTADNTAHEKANFEAVSEEEITFTFDTVFIVRKNGHTNLKPLKKYLNSIGDCLIIGEDDEAFKVHVHTDIPGNAIAEAQKYGTLEVAKVENMRIQAQDVAQGKTSISADDLDAGEEAEAPAIAPAEKRYGFLAVCAGDGLAETFKALGVDTIVSGGQTMNPSTESILEEVNRTPSEVVFILPNNKNIIMAAQQCVGLTEKQVIVVPTATVPQGITAMMTVDTDEVDPNVITETMIAAAETVTTAQITYAARDSEFDGFSIKEGDYLALLDGKLFSTDRDIDALLAKLAVYAGEKGCEYVNVYTGEGVDDAAAEKAEQLFAATGAEIAVVPGGQPVYYYIISME